MLLIFLAAVFISVFITHDSTVKANVEQKMREETERNELHSDAIKLFAGN